MAEFVELTYGNLAYDPFGTAAPQIQVPQQEPEAPPQEDQLAAEMLQRRIRLQEEVEARAVRANRLSLAAYLLVSIPGVLVSAALVLSLLQAKTRLTVVSAQSAALENRIGVLELENRSLAIESESAYNMEAVEQTARVELGMVKAESGQFVYLQGAADDVAMIVDEQVAEAGLGSQLQNILHRIGSYLKGLLS